MNVCGKNIKINGRLVRVARLDGDKFEFPDAPEEILTELRSCGNRIDLFTFLQRFQEPVPRFPYPTEWDNLAVLPVSTFEHWWHKQIRSYPRNRARQAEKRGVVLREIPFDEALLRGICEVYNECPIRQGKRFPHYGMTIERAREYAGTFLDRSIFIGAFIDNNMIGFGKLITDAARTQACLIHILSMVKHKEKAPTNALIAQAVRSCADRRISHLVYEHFTYGKKVGDSLSHFKEVNGFERVNVLRYYVPLTSLGRVAFSLRLHHRLVDNLPAPLTSTLRDFRTSFYSRKFKTLKEA